MNKQIEQDIRLTIKDKIMSALMNDIFGQPERDIIFGILCEDYEDFARLIARRYNCLVSGQ